MSIVGPIYACFCEEVHNILLCLARESRAYEKKPVIALAIL